MNKRVYRDRLSVLLSVERDRWKDFIELCDKERKSYSRKFNELLEQELEKNALGSDNPLNLPMNTYVSNPNKPCQTDLTQWVETVHQNKDNPRMLSQIEMISKACANTARSYIKQGSWRFRK